MALERYQDAEAAYQRVLMDPMSQGSVNQRLVQWKALDLPAPDTAESVTDSTEDAAEPVTESAEAAAEPMTESPGDVAEPVADEGEAIE